MTEHFQVPDWVEPAFAQARLLADEANARWASMIGDPGLFGGFQVEPVTQEINGKDELRYASVRYGGRTFVGTPREVSEAQLDYIRSRAKGGRKAAA